MNRVRLRFGRSDHVQQGDGELGGRDAGSARLVGDEFVGAEPVGGRARPGSSSMGGPRYVQSTSAPARGEPVSARQRERPQRGRDVRRVLHQHAVRDVQGAGAADEQEPHAGASQPREQRVGTATNLASRPRPGPGRVVQRRSPRPRRSPTTWTVLCCALADRDARATACLDSGVEIEAPPRSCVAVVQHRGQTAQVQRAVRVVVRGEPHRLPAGLTEASASSGTSLLVQRARAVANG